MIRNETGAALPIILIVVFSLTVIGFILYMNNMQESRSAIRDEEKMKAHYIARSGAHALAEYLTVNQDVAKAMAVNPDNNPFESYSDEVELGGGHYRVKAELVGSSPENGDDDDQKNEILVTSTGEYGAARQSLQVTVTIQGINAPVVFSELDGQSTSFGANIYGGDMLYLGDILTQEDLDNLSENLEEGHEVYTGSDYEPEPFDDPWEDEILKEIFGTDDPGNAESAGNDWIFAEFEDESDDNYYDSRDDLVINHYEKIRYDEENNQGDHEMEVSNQGSLTINATGENNNILLYAENLDMGNQADITVNISDGNVAVIYVKEDLNMSNLSAISTDGTGGHLLIYCKNFKYAGNDVIQSDNVHINMYVHPDGEVELTGTGGINASIYAPQANYVHSGTGEFHGWIITKVLKGTSAAGDIHYDDINMFNIGVEFDFPVLATWYYAD